MGDTADRRLPARVDAPVAVRALPWIDPGRKIDLTVAHGLTVAEIVAISLPSLTTPELVRVTIGDMVVTRENWARVRPRPGMSVVVRVLPGNSNLLRSVLTITIAVAALALGQFYGAALAGSALGSMLGMSATAGSALISGSVLLVGTLLVNAFVPVRKKGNDPKESPTYSIQGWRNPINPDGSIPVVMGRHRFAPPHAAYPYTWSYVDDQYVTALFCVGYGPVEITNIRIGETPIEKYSNVTVQVMQGIAGELQQTLYPSQVIEEQVSVELSWVRAVNVAPDARFTAADSTEFSIDIQFPGGLAAFVDTKVGNTQKSVRQALVIPFTLRIREETSAVWTDIGGVQVLHATTKPFTRTFRFPLPTRGRYEIELARGAPDWDDWDQSYLPAQITSRAFWTVIRSYRPEAPINVNFPLAMIAVQVRATGQLNGTLDNLSADVALICPDWDAPTQTWITRATRNPASLFRYALQGRPFTYPVDDGAIDLDALADWHGFCASKGLTYNRVHDTPSSLYEALADIAAAGRASPHHDGERWTVVIDRPQDVIVGHVSPRNSWGFHGERSFVRYPDAFRVKFKDETSKFGFQDAERIILWPGFTGDPEATEEIDLPGITNPEQVWREARRRQYEAMYRLDTWTVSQDFEGLTVSRGDRVQLSHDVLDRVMVSARVTAVSDATVVLDEIVTMEAHKAYAVRFRRETGETLLRQVVTVEGESGAVVLSGDGDVPQPGDLALFGPAARETFDALVKGIEGGEDMTRHLTIVAHAPEISQLADSDEVPPWNGRAGADVDTSRAPGIPSFGAIVTGFRAGGTSRTAIYAPVVASTSGFAPASYEINHRLVGAPAWTSVVFAAPSGATLINGYALADSVELRVRALSASTPPDASDWSATTTVIVGAQDARSLDFSKKTNVSAFGLGW